MEPPADDPTVGKAVEINERPTREHEQHGCRFASRCGGSRDPLSGHRAAQNRLSQRRRGGSHDPCESLSRRDHQDLGSSICTIGGVGAAHFFHSSHLDPDQSQRTADDRDTLTISWPNYHSGSNGDYQRVTKVEPVHDLLRNPASPSGLIEFFPAHPHEGGVGVAQSERDARVFATGISQATGRPFNLVVAFERKRDEHGNNLGRAVAESSFHHFVDYTIAWWLIYELGQPRSMSQL
jgi:hypothetical protein